MTRYFVDAEGRYLGGFDGYQPPEQPIFGDGPEPSLLEKMRGALLGKPALRARVVVGYEKPPFVSAEPPAGAIEVPVPPEHGADRWDGTRWVPDLAARQRAMEASMTPQQRLLQRLADKGVLSEEDLEDIAR